MNTSRSAFTLMEMLVVVALLTTLLGMGAAGMRVADNISKETRTRSTIQKLNQFVVEKYASYQYRRVSGNTVQARLQNLYNMMRYEMPDHQGEITSNSPYRLQLAKNSIISGDSIQSAEILYQIVMGMPEAASAFGSMEIADTNGNGLNEFVDGWGNPIYFIRWPAGHCNGNNRVISKIQNGTDPDPFDPNGILCKYAVFPLIYSCGPDRASGFNNSYSGTTPTNSTAGGVSSSSDYFDNITNHNL